VRDRLIWLEAGMNLVTWTAATQSARTATAGLGAIVVVHAFDAASQRSKTYRGNSPAALDSLRWLLAGHAVWLEMAVPTVWQQGTRPRKAGMLAIR
jgi:hypothetical protein